jgi:hypothetical protein
VRLWKQFPQTLHFRVGFIVLGDKLETASLTEWAELPGRVCIPILTDGKITELFISAGYRPVEECVAISNPTKLP